MAKDQVDTRAVLEKLAELKRTLPEDEYQELERQVLPRLMEQAQGSKQAEKKSGWASTVGSILWIVIFWCLIFPGLGALIEKSFAGGHTLAGIGLILLLIFLFWRTIKS